MIRVYKDWLKAYVELKKRNIALGFHCNIELPVTSLFQLLFPEELYRKSRLLQQVGDS